VSFTATSQTISDTCFTQEQVHKIAEKIADLKACQADAVVFRNEILEFRKVVANYEAQLNSKDIIINATNDKANAYKKQMRKERFWKSIYMIGTIVEGTIIIGLTLK